jgi:hypothetical protein
MMAKCEGSAGRWPKYDGPSVDSIAAEIFTRLAVHTIRERVKKVTINDMNDGDVKACCFEKCADLAIIAAKRFQDRATD